MEKEKEKPPFYLASAIPNTLLTSWYYLCENSFTNPALSPVFLKQRFKSLFGPTKYNQEGPR